MNKEINYKKIRINGWSTVNGHFYKHPPTGTFGTGGYPELHKAYLIVKVKEHPELADKETKE